MSEFEFTDRYKALGIPYPDPVTTCDGQCDGVGVYPHHHQQESASLRLEGQPDETPEERQAWEVEHGQAHRAWFLIQSLFNHWEVWFWRSVLRDLITGAYRECDGWHFIKCADCEGTGKKQ